MDFCEWDKLRGLKYIIGFEGLFHLSWLWVLWKQGRTETQVHKLNNEDSNRCDHKDRC